MKKYEEISFSDVPDLDIWYDNAVMVTDEEIIRFMENPESLRNPESCAF